MGGLLCCLDGPTCQQTIPQGMPQTTAYPKGIEQAAQPYPSQYGSYVARTSIPPQQFIPVTQPDGRVVYFAPQPDGTVVPVQGVPQPAFQQTQQRMAGPQFQPSMGQAQQPVVEEAGGTNPLLAGAAGMAAGMLLEKAVDSVMNSGRDGNVIINEGYSGYPTTVIEETGPTFLGGNAETTLLGNGGETVVVEKEQPGFFGSLFGGETETMVVQNGETVVVEETPGFFGSMFGTQEETIVEVEDRDDIIIED